jgi:transcriptional regulator GlxA family with amidase domain
MSNAPSTPFTIGALIFDSFELLDVFGPLEMFGMLEDRVRIVLLASVPAPIPSAQGPKAVAEVRLAGEENYDLLLVPGGIGTRTAVKDVQLIEMLIAKALRASYVASVCTGAALLARAGLINEREATTNKFAFDWVATQGPRVRWVRRARWVVDGKFWTSSGAAAGMDMALAVIQHVFGRDTALSAARRAEYLWNEDSSHDPFACGSDISP